MLSKSPSSPTILLAGLLTLSIKIVATPISSINNKSTMSTKSDSSHNTNKQTASTWIDELGDILHWPRCSHSSRSERQLEPSRKPGSPLIWIDEFGNTIEVLPSSFEPGDDSNEEDEASLFSPKQSASDLLSHRIVANSNDLELRVQYMEGFFSGFGMVAACIAGAGAAAVAIGRAFINLLEWAYELSRGVNRGRYRPRRGQSKRSL